MAWGVALAGCAAWYQYDVNKARKFTQDEAQVWNTAILQKERREKKPN